MAERDWPVRVSIVRYRDRQYRIVRPACPLGVAGLYEERFGAQFCLDEQAAAVFAMAWGLAARSPHSIIYLPLRRAAAPEEHGWGRPLDLVLLHHRLALPPARWKHVRARLGVGVPRTVTLPASEWPKRPLADHLRSGYREFRDHLRWHIAGDTLILTGSREAFELEADRVRVLAEEWPARRAEAPDTHCCIEIGMGRTRPYPDRRYPDAVLHAEYCR
ncbi:MAG: hypothetical protein IRY92_03360 [Dactylosporangium sp.]|nr:hypothetical protein [Dactylosporangium sp.]